MFSGQYFQELLPAIKTNLELADEAKDCIACHSPIDYIAMNGRIFSKEQADPDKSGVTCDFCHTITGYKGGLPGNGAYISEPLAERKFGPFLHEYNWHHIYSAAQTKSEFCAICHNAVNHNGLEIKATYTEWKNSSYAERGINCQDCHMNALGFLSGGKPVFESGRAADPSRTFGRGTPFRPVLFTHRFPGAHTRTQISGGADITLKSETEKRTVSPGDEIIIRVNVDNSNTGHKFPSGSSDLRLLWLELTARIGDNVIVIPAVPDGKDPFDVTGQTAFDREILGDDIQKGNRIYRAVFTDKTGKQTLASYNATKIIFDNRLNASEIRKETYHFRVPENAAEKIIIEARLSYLPYPSSFSRRFDLPKPERFEIADMKTEITVK